MRPVLAAGLAFAALSATAFAQPERQTVRHIEMHERSHRVELSRIDADEDGWLSRAEATAEADRVFDEMDSNDDGRLTAEDRAAPRVRRLVQSGDGADVLVIPHGGEDDDHRTVQVIRRGVAAPESEDVHREVFVLRMGEATEQESEGPAAPRAPVPPRPPRPPMHMMMLMSADESDLNGDGALSREEFRAQQLRFFDAGDANRDGRIRFEAPPIPPVPPEPPVAPAPPRR